MNKEEYDLDTYEAKVRLIVSEAAGHPDDWTKYDRNVVDLAEKADAQIAALKESAARMRAALGAMEGAMYGCDDLIDLKETWEDDGPMASDGHKVRDELLLEPRLKWGELKRIFAALDELNAIVNDEALSAGRFE